MFGWKAKYGVYYLPQNYSSVPLGNVVGKNVNDTVFQILDDSIMSFGSRFNGSYLPVSSGGVNEAQNAVESSMADDFYSIYSCPIDFLSSTSAPSGSQPPYNADKLLEYIPSSIIQCRKTFDASNVYLNGAGRNFCFMYIEGLKLFYISQRLHRVDENGVITSSYQLLSGAQAQFFNLLGTNGTSNWYLNYLIFPDYNGTVESILNGRWISLLCSTTNRYTASYTEYNPGNYPDSIKNVIDFIFNAYTPPNWDNPIDPYPIPPSEPGDLPPGTFDDTSDPIPIPPLPSISAANTGFTRIYNPTLSQVQALARYLWTEDSVIETIWNHIKQFFEDPMQAIIGFNLVPVQVPDGGTEEFALMYIGTGVQMTVAANQFVDVDCGELKLERYYGSALDQLPYTKIHCFLPYIGTVRLNTDEVMGATLSIKYRVDIVTGSCVAMVLVDGNVLYQYSGHCAINIPVSSADFSSYVSAAINVAKTIGMGVAMGAAGAVAGVAGSAAEAGQATSSLVSSTELAIPGGSGAIMPSAGSSGGYQHIPVNDYIMQHPPVAGPYSSPASFSGLTPQNIANTVSQVNSGKPNIEHSGSFTGNSGYLGIRRPFLIIERPNMCLPENYQSLNGYPAMITMELGTCKGYTRIQQVQLTGMTATNPEQAEILQLLKGGVVF